MFFIYYDGEPLDDDIEGYPSLEKATFAAQDWWAEKCEEEGVSVGETCEGEAEVREGYFDDDGGFVETGPRTEVNLEYTAERSDHAEHFNQGAYL